MRFLKQKLPGGIQIDLQFSCLMQKFFDKASLIHTIKYFIAQSKHIYFFKPLTKLAIGSTTVPRKLKVARNFWLSFIAFQKIHLP